MFISFCFWRSFPMTGPLGSTIYPYSWYCVSLPSPLPIFLSARGFNVSLHSSSLSHEAMLPSAQTWSHFPLHTRWSVGPISFDSLSHTPTQACVCDCHALSWVNELGLHGCPVSSPSPSPSTAMAFSFHPREESFCLLIFQQTQLRQDRSLGWVNRCKCVGIFLMCKQGMAKAQCQDKPGSRGCFWCSAATVFLFTHAGLGADQGLLDQDQQSATSAVLAWPPAHMQGH